MYWDHDHMNEMWGYSHQGFAWFGIVSSALSFIFFLLIIWLIYRAVTKFAPVASRKFEKMGTKETPREILDRRLASGEINAEEYQASRKLLDS